MRLVARARARLFEGIGTSEALIEERGTVTLGWRKPLRIDEINRMAQTPEVRERKGRP